MNFAPLRLQRKSALRKSRRETIYRMLAKKFGIVPCFVCKKHVEKVDATLEHILPTSKGGTDAMANLSISHESCNRARGNRCEP